MRTRRHSSGPPQPPAVHLWGEQYRSFLFAPWTEWQERVWDVHTESYFLQAETSRAGARCSDVAKAVHEHQVANECAHLIYHRPGHGEGMEGHQPPYMVAEGKGLQMGTVPCDKEWCFLEL